MSMDFYSDKKSFITLSKGILSEEASLHRFGSSLFLPALVLVEIS
jgi:hypothetical protein